MMLLGLLWAAAAPLLLLLPAALLAHGLQRARPAWSHRRRRAVAGALTLAAVATLWVPERLHFAQLCTDLGPPRVLQRAQADGIFLDDPTANSFGTRYLYDEGFTWMEARSIYRRDAFTRYRKVDGRIVTEEIDSLTAAYAVQSTHEVRDGGVSVQRTTVSERASGRMLASAAMAHFEGGRAKWVLGAWGSASCPSPISAEGSAAFQAAYHLARDTLRGR
jgi:hypothetical protein